MPTTNVKSDDPENKGNGIRKRLSAKIGGISCRLPRSNNVQEFWENLMQSVDMLGPTRWPPGMFGIPPRTGLLPNYNQFDANFFNTLTEASYMSVALYSLLEVIHECVVDSGVPYKILIQKKTGIYLAMSFNDDDVVTTTTASESDYLNIKSEFIGRIFKLFGFNGPAASVDTACSSSISALQMAILDLSIGRSDYAIVAGANLILNPQHSIQFLKLGLLSPSGISRPFDSEANGYVRSEGVVAVLLASRSPLKREYAEICDLLCLSDGYKEGGVHHTSKESQINLLRELYNGEDVVYIEAHATGTKVHDAVEAAALAEVFCKNRISPLLVGSCKSNLGHTEACSGLVSLLKCVLSIQHCVIPPNINYNQPSPEIDEILKCGLKIVTEPTKLPTGNIGFSCFGFGGAIGHVILKRCENIPEKLSNVVLIPLHIQDNKQYNKFLDFTTTHARRPEVLSFLSSSFFSRPMEDAHAGYISVFSNKIKMRTTTEKRIVPVWLVFHDGLFMDINTVNKDLLNIEYFQQSFLRYDTILTSLGYCKSLMELLSEVYSTFRERLLLSTALLMAYVDLLKLCDFQPDVVCGYGLAEIVIAYYDGCIDQDQCLKIAYQIGTYFTNSDHEDNKRISLEVRLPMLAKSCLPDVVTMIAVLNEDTFYIRLPPDYVDNIDKIDGALTRTINDIPVFNSNDKQLDTLLSDLRATFRPRDRSFRWISSLDLMYPSKSTKIENRRFDYSYIHRILTNCVDIPAVLRQLPSVKKLHLNGAAHRSYISTNDIYCSPTCASLITTLGELYLLSKNEKFGNVNPDVFPLDSTAPSIGHLVSWDHSFEWPVASWTQFLIPKKSLLGKTYCITGYDGECYDPMSVLLFETIYLITGMNFSIFMQVYISAEMNRKDIEDAEIEVLWYSGRVSVVKDDDILMIGRFQIENIFHGFFLDIEEIFQDENIVKYEVLWQGDIMEFMNTIFEYGYSYFRTYLTAVIFDPMRHKDEVNTQRLLLATFELETGICQSGGLVLQFSPATSVPYLKDLASPKCEDVLVQSMLVYDISKQTTNTVLIFSGRDSRTGKAKIGISLFLDECFYHRYIDVDRPCRQNDLTKILPYLISHYLIHRVLQLQPEQTLLIHPPYDAVFLFLIEMASAFCRHIYVSSWSLEHSSDLEEMFPGVSSVWGLYLNNEILSLTKGLGCDAAITTSGTDINNAFTTLADNGKLVLLGIPNPSEYIGMSVFLKNLTLQVTEPCSAVFEFLKQEDSTLDSELVNGILNTESYQFWDGYSLEKSFLYNLLHAGEFETPIRLTKIINYFESYEDNSEFVSNFADNSWNILQNIKRTLSSYRKIFQSPVSFSQGDKTLQQSPMKPSIVVTLPQGSSLNTEDSCFQNSLQNLRINLNQWKKKLEDGDRNVPSPLNVTSFADEELLVMSPPKPDFSPRIKQLMKLGEYKDNLVPLNSIQNGEKPLFIVHPVTGDVLQLKPLGQMLTIPCFGIRMTDKTPRHSVEDMAEFYISVIEAAYPSGSYRLAGYSFGAGVALEMALQLETSNRPVEILIMLNGSPEYFHSHCDYIRRDIPRDCPTKVLIKFMNIGYILGFISIYKTISNDTKLQIHTSLLKLKDIESKLEWAVNYLFGKPITSPPPGKKNWLMAYTKLRMKKQPILSTTTEILRISRTQKCRFYIQNCHLGYKYNPKKNYNGCIHLLRIKMEPTDSLALPSDYGLSKFCTNVCINYYDGNRLTFLKEINLANDIEALLKEKD